MTGAAGFTGLHFERQARQHGHTVIDISADLTDASVLRTAVERAGPADALVHLAAISFVGHASEADFYAVNTVGSTALLAAFASLPALDRPRKLLVASSANIYGNCPQSPIAETQPPAPVNHYATSKLAMEHMAQAYADRLPVVITRPFNYTGPGQSLSFLIPKIVDHFVRCAPVIELGNLHVEREFNDVRMVCEAYLGLLEHGVPGQIYNVCSGQPHTLQSVLGVMMELTGHRPEVRVNPSLVRANEVHRLCGNASRLLACTGPLKSYTLKDTLLNMIEACRADAPSA